MTRRRTEAGIESLDDLAALSTLVRDKREHKRTHAKRGRRNRHVQREWLRHAISQAAIETADAEGFVDPP